MDPGRTNHIIQYEINTVAGNTERNINYKCNALLELVYGVLLPYPY